MLISKIFNNNVALIKNNDKKEIVVMGCGITFGKRVGDYLDDDKVEKVFKLQQEETSEKFKLLLEHIPMEEVALCYDIIEYAKGIINVEFSDYIYVTLTDHINRALKLFDDGYDISNPLIWEIKRLYPKEFAVGKKALELIEEAMDKQIPEAEAGNIAMHLINAQLNPSSNEFSNVFEITQKVQDILNIVKYTFKIELDEKSLDFERFVTHLRFFFRREKGQAKGTEADDFLLLQIKATYEEAYSCMKKVEQYLGKVLSSSQQLYLTVHIQRVTQL